MSVGGSNPRPPFLSSSCPFFVNFLSIFSRRITAPYFSYLTPDIPLPFSRGRAVFDLTPGVPLSFSRYQTIDHPRKTPRF